MLADRARYRLFHLMDGRVNPQSGNGYDMGVEFGVGDIDYQAFLGALTGSGRQHGIWEQDNAATVPSRPMRPTRSATQSAAPTRSSPCTRGDRSGP